MNHLILRMTAITVAILSIAVLDGIVSGQTAPWTGLFTIAALLGMAAWSYSKQTKREAPARAANTDKRQAVKLNPTTASIVTHQGGIHRKAAERLLQVSKLLDNSTPREQKVLEELTPSVLYEASRPSAEPEAVEALKSKQVKTLKEFRALEAQIKAEREAREKAVAEAESLRYANDALRDEAATARAQAKHAQEKADALETRPVMSELFDAKERIKELEARPVEVAVQEPDPAEVERRAGEKAREMTAMLQAQVRGMQEDLDDARKIIDSAESATYMAAAEFAVNAAQVLNGIRASFWAVAKELSDEDFSSAAAPLLEAANRIVDCEWDDDEEEQE